MAAHQRGSARSMSSTPSGACEAVLTRDQAKALTDRIIALSHADEVHVSVGSGREANLRFANGSPLTSGERTDTTVTVTCVSGNRSGTASINQLDAGSLETVVRRAEAIAKLAPEDREHVAALGAQEYPEVEAAFDPHTAEHGAEALPAGVKICLERAERAKVVAAGFAETRVHAAAIANSAGLFGYHRLTDGYVGETARTRDGNGSGWACDSSRRIGEVDFARVAATATRKALASASPQPLAAGSYPTILEPACVANLVGLLVDAMDARSADEGRSYFSAAAGGSRVGETVAAPGVHLYSDPRDPRAPGAPWGDGGLPQRRVDWIADGALRTLPRDRFWAREHGGDPVPKPGNILMDGGNGSVDELIALTERGVLVTSLWYVRSLDPRSLLFTGLTRDGVFWIEDGRITHPVNNFRWNDSPIAVLKNIAAMSRPVQVPPRPSRTATTVVPALKLTSFHFSSVSEAV